MLDWLVTLKGEPGKVKNKFFEHLLARNEGAFDKYVVLNSLSNWHRILIIIKKGKVIFSLKLFNKNKNYLKISMFLKEKYSDVEKHIFLAALQG